MFCEKIRMLFNSLYETYQIVKIVKIQNLKNLVMMKRK